MAQLLALSTDPAFRTAITGFANGSSSQAPYTLPQLYSFNDSDVNQLSFDPEGNQLIFTGLMTDGEYAVLRSLSSDANYLLAIDNLYHMQRLQNVNLAVSTLSLHQHTLLAALQINNSDFSALLAGNFAIPDALNLDKLSKLYRSVLLAQGLSLSIPDFLSLRFLSGMDPFATPGACLRFINLANEVARSNFSIAQLNYIYANINNAVSSVGPANSDLMQLINSLISGLKQINQTDSYASDPKGTRLKQVLASLFDAATVSTIMGIVNGSQIYNTPLINPITALPGNVKDYLSIGLSYSAPLRLGIPEF